MSEIRCKGKKKSKSSGKHLLSKACKPLKAACKCRTHTCHLKEQVGLVRHLKIHWWSCGTKRKKKCPIIPLRLYLQSLNSILFQHKSWNINPKSPLKRLRVGYVCLLFPWVSELRVLFSGFKVTQNGVKLYPLMVSSLKHPKSSQGQWDLQTSLNNLLFQVVVILFAMGDRVKGLCFRSAHSAKTQWEVFVPSRISNPGIKIPKPVSSHSKVLNKTCKVRYGLL